MSDPVFSNAVISDRAQFSRSARSGHFFYNRSEVMEPDILGLIHNAFLALGQQYRPANDPRVASHPVGGRVVDSLLGRFLSAPALSVFPFP